MIAVFGPTGVGKTEIAVELAGLLRARGEDPIAVSADAIAVYEGLDVLAAKPATEQLEHRLVSCVPIDEEFSAGRFAALAHAEVDALLDAGRTPIVVGGTGLYLRAALTDLDLRPPVERDVRAGLERELAAVGPAALHGRLSPQTAASVHPNDRKRIVRALELELAGTPPHAASEQLWSEDLRRPAALFGVVMDRDALAARIESRAQEMLAAGAVEEVERALERGASRTARKALGFKEIEAHLAGRASLDEVRERIERGHRAYVRRQLTWMRKLSGVEVIDRTGLSARAVAERILGVSDSPLELVRAINDAWTEGRAGEVLPELFMDQAVIVGPDLSRLAEGRDACVESYVRFAEETDLIEFEEFDHRVDCFGPAALVDYAYRAAHRREGEQLTDYGRDVILAIETESGWQAAWRMARPDL